MTGGQCHGYSAVANICDEQVARFAAAIKLYYANQEVSVDEELAPFLKTMIEKQRFIAESATQWTGDGQCYPRETVREYFQVLLERGL